LLQVRVPTSSGNYIVSQGVNSNSNLFFRPGCDNDGEITGKLRSHEYTGGEIVLTAGRDGKQSSLAFQAKNAAGLLVWWSDTGPCTIEPLLDNRLLAPGQSASVDSSITLNP